MNLREKIIARRREMRAAKKLEADAMDGMEISRLLTKLGGRQVIRKAVGDDVVFTTVVALSAKQAFARAEKLLNTAPVPYTSDSIPSKGIMEIEAVGEIVTNLNNYYMCPDEDAGIVLIVNGLGEELSIVTMISQVY